MTLYFDIFTVVDHGLDLFLSHADDCFLYAFFRAVAVKLRRHCIRNLKVKPVQHLSEHLFRCMAVVQHGCNRLDILDILLQFV